MPDTPILLIDDEPAVLESLSEFLDDEGFEVHQARGGREGVEVFRAVNPEVVMTDLRMPGMSGIDLVREIRRINRKTPIILFTAYGSLETAIDAIRLDVFDFITKPIDLHLLKATLDRARESLRAAQEVQKEIESLKEELVHFQNLWRDQLRKFSEAEPLIHTGRLVAGILHNLNNPLTYIMGQADLIQMTNPDLPNIDAIRTQALRMKRIMATVMKRLKDSHVRQMDFVQLNEIIEEELFFMQSHPLFKAELSIHCDLSEDLPRVWGVAADFSQIIGNIIRNAAEAMSDWTHKEFFIRSWHDDQGIHVSFMDTGPGIPPESQQKIFQPFYSTKAGRQRSSAGGMGMGIGLFHCRELMQEYGGSIEVVSKSSVGSTFTIHLPLPVENPPAQPRIF